MIARRKKDQDRIDTVEEWCILKSYQRATPTKRKTMKKTMYQVREFIGSDYSIQLGIKLRDRKSALRIAKILKKSGREIILATLLINK